MGASLPKHARAATIASVAVAAALWALGEPSKAATALFLAAFGALLWTIDRDLPEKAARAMPSSFFFNQLSFLLELSAIDAAFAWGASKLGAPWKSSALDDAMGQPWMSLICVLVAALVAGDFIGYWRHRLEHSRWFWPVHEMHHSDEQMHWSTVFRFHPLNRLTTTAVDMGSLWALGFPWWSIFASAAARHYYGLVLHAQTGWTYGCLGLIFVSPAAHRIHHARDIHGKNFATFFACWDRMFGTCSLPDNRAAQSAVPTGVAGARKDFWQSLAAPLLGPLTMIARCFSRRQ